MSKSKYHAKKTMVYGIEFDSQKEAQHYMKLRSMEREGKIRNLKRQVEYELIPKQVTIFNGKQKTLRATHYVSDFEYDDLFGHHVVDVKGLRTREYMIKKKLMLWIHHIVVEEI